MAIGQTTIKPQIGRRVWPGGEIVAIVEAIHCPDRVVIKLDACSHTVTIPWTDPDDNSLVYPDAPEH
jgi:hypothetical protein